MTARTLLVVDDEPEIAKLVSRIFEARGMRVVSSGDGEDALAKVAAEKPNLVLLDIDLPRLDGWEVLKRLRADEATKDIPVVMMTAAHVSTDAAIRGLDGGADEYIAKPFLFEVLVHNVERLLAKSEE